MPEGSHHRPITIAALGVAAVLVGFTPHVAAQGGGDHSHATRLILERITRSGSVPAAPAELDLVVRCPEGMALVGIRAVVGSGSFTVDTPGLWVDDPRWGNDLETGEAIIRIRIPGASTLAGPWRYTLRYWRACRAVRTEPADGHDHKLGRTTVRAMATDLAHTTQASLESICDEPHASAAERREGQPFYLATGPIVSLPQGFELRELWPVERSSRFYGWLGWRLGARSQESTARPTDAEESTRGSVEVLCHADTTGAAEGHTHAFDSRVVERRVRIRDRAAAPLQRRKKTLRCPPGYRAIDYGYRLQGDAEFELVSAAIKPRRLMKRVKFTFGIAAGSTVHLYAVCLSSEVR